MCIFIRRQKCCTTAFNFSTSQNELTRLLWETLAQRSLHFYKDNTLSKPVDEFIWNFLVVRDGFGAIFWKKSRSADWKKKKFRIESTNIVFRFNNIMQMKDCLLFNRWPIGSLRMLFIWITPSCKTNGLKINSFWHIIDFVGDLFVLRVVDYLLSEIEKSIFANIYIHTRMHCEII